MECRHGNFWIGLGIGSILGAVAYRLSRTAKAKQLESEIYNAIHRIGRDAEIAAAHAERKAMDLGLKAVETGAEIADKVAAEADKVAGKAKISGKSKNPKTGNRFKYNWLPVLFFVYLIFYP